LIAFTLLVVIVWARKVPFVETFRKYWWLLFATAFLQISWNFGIAFWAVQHIESGLSATLYTTLPLFSLVYAHFMLTTEKITSPRLLGVLIGIAGVALIFSKQLQLPNPMAFLGSAGILIASLGMGLSQTLFKKYGRDVDAMLGVTFQIGVGLLPLLVIGLVFEGSPTNVAWTAKGVLSIVYLAVVGSAVAFALLYWLIQRIDVTKAALTPLVSTLTAVILGILVLGESFTWREVAGGVLIVSGLLITTLRVSSKSRKIIQTESQAAQALGESGAAD